MKSSNSNPFTFLPTSLFIGFMLLASSFSQAQEIFMSVEGVSQGMITAGATSEASLGERAVAGHDDEAIVLSLEHSITIPRDAQSGQPSGARLHQPIQVTSYIDKSTPLMNQALVTGESLEVIIKFFRLDSEGMPENYYTILLEEATVVDAQVWAPASDPERRQLVQYSFSYSTIAWTHETAGTEGSDDWRNVAD
jgi:type VI secretion system secreted protein Hcp